MNYDDEDEEYDRHRDWKLMAEIKHRSEVDKDYKSVTVHSPFYIYRNSPVELFSIVCGKLVDGMKIAVKIKDANLTERYWIVDVLYALTSLYVGKDQSNGVSAADSQKMAKEFVPVFSLFKQWATGRPTQEDRVDFQTGYKPLSFAGELHQSFVWLYDQLLAKGHNPAEAAHPILFMPLKREDNGETTYSLMSGKFLKLLSHCKIYRERHREQTEIDKLFETEMKKPVEERFFNLDDDEDDSIFDDGTDTGATERSRLKAYLHYRQEAYRLHTTKAGGCRSGFAYVLKELSEHLADAEKAVLHKYHEPLPVALPLLHSLLGGVAENHSWYDLLYDLLKMRSWISYRDYCVDGYEEEDKTSDAGYHDDGDGWPYFDVDENIPEHDICIEVRKKFKLYLSTLTALAFCIRSTVYPRFARAFELYESANGLMSRLFKKGDNLQMIIDTIKNNINRLEMEVELYKNGKSILAPHEKRIEELAARFDVHEKSTKTGFDAAHKDYEELCAKQEESLAMEGTINENTLMALRAARSRAAHHKVGLVFSIAVQAKCYRFWVEDRVDPTIADGHKPFRIDSFERRKRKLAEHEITDPQTYSVLIDRYMKRTGAKIPNTKRKLEKKRKAEERNRKRKTASKKRKSTPGRRNKK